MKFHSLTIIASIGVIISTAQPSFNKTYSSANGNATNGICSTSNQGMILTGFSRNPNNKDMLVVRTDNNGDTLWSRIYENGGSDEAYCVKEAMDGSIIIGGKKSITRLDAGGNIIWSYAGDFYIHEVQQTLDGRFLCVGDSAGVGLIWTIYQNGATNFASTFHFGSMTSFNSIRQTLDGGFIALGAVYNAGMVAVKTDGGGNMQWSKVYTLPVSQAPGFDVGASVVQVADSGYIIAGSFIHNTLGGKRLFLGKIDQTGAMQWSKCYGDLNRNITPDQVEVTADSGLIVFGTIDTATFDSRAWLMHTNATGDTLWTREYGAGQNIQLTGGLELTAGGFALSCRGANSDVSCFIKTDANGLSGCNEAHFPVSTLNIAATTQLLPGNDYIYSGLPYTSNNSVITSGITENILCYSVGITEAADDLSLEIYPNPSPGNFTIRFTSLFNEQAGFTIYDALGKSVITEYMGVMAGKNEIRLSEGLAEGIYFITLTGKELQVTKKLVILRN
jgi:hypothetical protein